MNTADGLRDEVAAAIYGVVKSWHKDTAAEVSEEAAGAVLEVHAEHCDNLKAERDDYRARLKATDESWAKVAAARDAAVARAEAAEQALRELVALKDGPRDDDYERRKPLAWEAARRVLDDQQDVTP